MDTLKISLIQTTTPSNQADALAHITPLIERAVSQGAKLILTPEGTNLMEHRRDQKRQKIVDEDTDLCVIGLRQLAKKHKVFILMGSVIVVSEGREHPVNRALMLSDQGEVIVRYDKIHLFHADTPDGRSYREGDAISAGDKCVVASLPFANIGLSICYDLRFAALYRRLAQNGAHLIAVNAAFTVPTGRAHWEVLLRARAIETGCYILAAAQGGFHEDETQTYGHSMVIDPWGEVVARLDHDRPDVLMAEIDLSRVEKARLALPQLTHDRPFSV